MLYYEFLPHIQTNSDILNTEFYAIPWNKGYKLPWMYQMDFWKTKYANIKNQQMYEKIQPYCKKTYNQLIEEMPNLISNNIDYINLKTIGICLLNIKDTENPIAGMIYAAGSGALMKIIADSVVFWSNGGPLTDAYTNIYNKTCYFLYNKKDPNLSSQFKQLYTQKKFGNFRKLDNGDLDYWDRSQRIPSDHNNINFFT